MKKIKFQIVVWPVILLCFFTANTSVSKQYPIPGNQSAQIKITFKNKVGNTAIALRDSTYLNPFGEEYSINKLRYYISQVSLINSEMTFGERDSYHLVDEALPESQSIVFQAPTGHYNSLQFLLGVDSLHNVSGAQTGALDPTKDMFWTWNTGYVMAKMEGNSSASKQVNNKYEFHIGGYAGPFCVNKLIKLDLSDSSSLEFKTGKTTEIIIEANINTWWKGAHDIKIAEHPVIATPGKMALEISNNYAKMFSIKKVLQ